MTGNDKGIILQTKPGIHLNVVYKTIQGLGLDLWCLAPLSTICHYIVAVSDLPYIEFFNIYTSYILILKHCYSGCKIYSNAINMGIYLNCFEFEPHSWRSVLDTTLFDKVCQGLATDR
jgi:hypothetical protein